MSRQTTTANPAEAFTAGDRIVHRRSLNPGTVEGDTSGAWNSVFVRWDNGDAGMVRPYDLRLADGYVVSMFRSHFDRPADCADAVSQKRAKLRREITTLRNELAETWDSAVCAELSKELERAEDMLADLSPVAA